MKLHKSVADYAAIAVAPILIFIMISALANFLMLILYSGGYAGRVSWIMLMFTMGVVAIARIAIEQNRAYSLGYAAALGGATFVVMSRLIGSPLFCAFILPVIGYLADVIVRDCTIIDDDVDASGEGLIDAGRLFMKKQLDGDSEESPDSQELAESKKKRQHQPGRTVMYLAFGALPLFGLGQFMLHNDSATWTRAQMFLGFYLFAALALLVTTSFLGLRRYLRQRDAEMPADVTVSWLGGGIAMIAAVLLIAYIVPLPGQALASIEMPEFIDSNRDLSASSQGWGDEGADKSKQDAALTSDDENAEGKEIHSETMKEGGEAGDVGDGDREDGPAGKKTGGEKETSGESESEGDSEKSKQESGGDSESKEQNAESEQQQSQNESDKQSSEENKSSSEEQSKQPSEASDSKSQKTQSPSSQSNSVMETVSNLTSGLGSLLKLIIMLVLAVVVARFAWLNWGRFMHWIQSLLNADEPQETETFDTWEPDPATPPRPFSSYKNPIGNESDLRRVVVITFQAFEAWAREQGASREKDETPSEFVRRASQSVENVGAPVAQVVDAYNRIVYGRGKATERDVDAANQVWQLMR